MHAWDRRESAACMLGTCGRSPGEERGSAGGWPRQGRAGAQGQGAPEGPHGRSASCPPVPWCSRTPPHGTAAKWRRRWAEVARHAQGRIARRSTMLSGAMTKARRLGQQNKRTPYSIENITTAKVSKLWHGVRRAGCVRGGASLERLRSALQCRTATARQPGRWARRRRCDRDMVRTRTTCPACLLPSAPVQSPAQMTRSRRR
jgi:hypothetical protein